MKKKLAISISLMLIIFLSACFASPDKKEKTPIASPIEDLVPTPKQNIPPTITPRPTFQPMPESTAKPSPSPSPSHTPEAIEQSDCLVSASRLNVRKTPDFEGDALGQLPQGMIIKAKDLKNGWKQIDYEEQIGYVSSEYSPVVTIGKRLHDLVDVRSYISGIYAYMIFAYDDNITGQARYQADICLLRKETADKLKVAAELFAKDGYIIKLYDAYRPLSVTKILQKRYPDSPYVAQSSNGSRHNKGCAVDMTLVNLKGYELEMPSKMHTLDETSNRDNPLMTERARKNMDYMARIMKKAGFTTIRSEWWHFDDANHKQYQALDYPIKDFIK